jgi:tetratricopeptide (TPR) repeat protein
MEESNHPPFWLARGVVGKRKIIVPMIYFVSLFSFLFILAVGAIGEDRIRLKNGEVLQGQAVKFDEGSMTLTFKFAQGTLGYPSSDLAEVNLEERPGVAEGRQAFAKGNWEEVVNRWKPSVEALMGVDSPWVLECAGGLGQAYLALGKVADAETHFGKMKKFYAQGPAALRASVGLAEATQNRDAGVLLEKLKELEGQLKEGLRPLRADREALAEYYFARGGAYEKKGDAKKALEDYLRVATLYPEPPSLGQRAEERAEGLRKANKDLVTE